VQKEEEEEDEIDIYLANVFFENEQWSNILGLIT
jgi:hypothetical protein